MMRVNVPHFTARQVCQWFTYIDHPTTDSADELAQHIDPLRTELTREFDSLLLEYRNGTALAVDGEAVQGIDDSTQSETA
ncbi:MAG TPA: hypothetical protein VHC20_01530 [Candidatus Paceibacterota bacterium]|nr:hypothetical protein [Candidatus Paceibacterota bacterium]